MGGGYNDAQGGKAPLSAAEVGGSFVLQYYRTLTTDKDNLHKYYKDESICSRGFEGSSPDQIAYGHGVDEIREEIRTSPTLGASRAEINCIQSQESKQGGILVLVLGYFAYSNSSQKVHFTQVFLLDKQTEPYSGYFVLNDILRYVTGKPEQWELQAQPQTELPPPILPPPQRPMHTEIAVVEAAAVEAPAAEEPAEEEEEEEEAAEVVEEEEQEGEEPVPDNTAAEEAAAVAEAVAAAAAADEAEEKPSPPSWASMASKLKEGGGTLTKSKVQGFSLPAPPKAKSASASLPSAAAKFSAASSTTPVLPPASAAAKAKAKAAATAVAATEEVGEVRLWLSRLPTETTVENQELSDCINKLIADAGMEGHVEIDHRRDTTKDSVYVTGANQDVADMLVQASKDRKVSVRGKVLKLESEKQKASTSNRRGNNNTSGKGGEDGTEAKPRRGKGEKGGGKGAKGGADAGNPDKQERSAARGGEKGNRRGGEKGGGGNWRAQS